MDRKAFLVLSVKVFTIVGLIAFSYPFIASLNPSAKAVNNSLVLIEFPPLKPGIINSVEVKGYKLFILRPNKEQITSIKKLDHYVSMISTTNYHEDVDAYVYWAYSSKWGCPIDHKPLQTSQLLEWNKNSQWLGGYWDSWCEVSYDYAGRAISRHEYTFNGYTWDGEGLKTPKILKKNGEKYVVSIYQR